MITFDANNISQHGYLREESLDTALLKQFKVLPIRVFERPFAVDPYTKLMQLGGLFIASPSKQLIGIYYTPVIAPLEPPAMFEGFYFAVKPDPTSGIVITSNPPGHRLGPWLYYAYPENTPLRERATLMFLEADFTNAKPGKHMLRFEGYAILMGFLVRRPEYDFEKPIFVIKTTADHHSNNYIAECPAGSLVLHEDRRGVYSWMEWKDWLKPRLTLPMTAAFNRGVPPLIVPIEFTLEMYPGKPFYGKLGPIPFEDVVWWKILAAILAAICAILSAIFGTKVALSTSKWQCEEEEGADGYKKSCAFLGTTEEKWYAGLGLFFSACTAGLIKAALADEKDPFRLGEENTTPSPNEATIKEIVHTRIEYKSYPNVAGPVDMKVAWQFERWVDSGKSYTFTHQWDIHVDPISTKVTLPKSKYHLGETVNLSVSLTSGATKVQGTDAYVLAWLFGPKGQFKAIPMTDSSDSPGTYESAITLTSGDDIGDWNVYIIAQSVDQASDYLPAEVAAKFVGGTIMNQILLLDSKQPCAELVKGASFNIGSPVIE
jgi:hypothetical protein